SMMAPNATSSCGRKSARAATKTHPTSVRKASPPMSATKMSSRSSAITISMGTSPLACVDVRVSEQHAALPRLCDLVVQRTGYDGRAFLPGGHVQPGAAAAARIAAREAPDDLRVGVLGARAVLADARRLVDEERHAAVVVILDPRLRRD